MKPNKFLLTCEHAGNKIPEKYSPLFKDNLSVLKSHRGYDIGSLDMFNFLAPISDYNRYNTISRLLIELNRSLDSPDLFSEYSQKLTTEEKKVLINNPYLEYRNDVEEWIKNQIDKGHFVKHISVHTFTDVFEGTKRNSDISFLYDPLVKDELYWSHTMKQELKLINSGLKIRMNYPYKGVSDGFPAYLRTKFNGKYAGIELEINQKYSENNKITLVKKPILDVLEKSINI